MNLQHNFLFQAVSTNYITERWGNGRSLTRFYLEYIWLWTYNMELEIISFVGNNTSGFTEHKTKSLPWGLHPKTSLGKSCRATANTVIFNFKIKKKIFTIKYPNHNSRIRTHLLLCYLCWQINNYENKDCKSWHFFIFLHRVFLHF